VGNLSNKSMSEFKVIMLKGENPKQLTDVIGWPDDKDKRRGWWVGCHVIVHGARP
jgi:hypothetical protein